MNVTIATIDQQCNQPEGQNCGGETLERNGFGTATVRKYKILDGKPHKLFSSREAAIVEATKLGYTVVD